MLEPEAAGARTGGTAGAARAENAEVKANRRMIKLQVDLLSLIQYNRIIKLPTKKELIQ